MESVYLTLFLDALKLRNFHIVVKNVANGGCLGICMFRRRHACERKFSVHYHILREASACWSVQLRWAMRRPQGVERATVWLSRFVFYIICA